MIPKIIYQSWYTMDLHPAIQNKIDNTKRLNPNYFHKIYTDEEIDAFVQENYPGEIFECYNRLNIVVAKVDLWRYLILYKYGGVYLDMDSSIERPLDELIRDRDQAIITSEGNKEFYVQWALIFNKGHPILKKTIEFIVDNIKTNRYPNDIHKMTGPSVFTKAINFMNNEVYGDTVHMNSEHTDIEYIKEEVSYRIYGIDYNKCFCYKYDEHHLLYSNRESWHNEIKYKKLLKD
jgi:mannosyltransferase OCH1-like enzyme